MIAHESAAPERFRGWIARRLGLHFDDTKLEFLADMLSRRAEQKSLPLSRYLDRLEGPDHQSELRTLIPELTVPETYFFRHMEQFHAFAEIARAATRRLNVLSVGCASGEEPYSLAMVLREQTVSLPWSIRAIDINPDMLAKATRGVYSAWALRDAPAESKQRWFRNVRREFVLDESIRAAVSFQEINLSRENTELWIPSFYEVIFCRNVLMYFTPECSQALVARITRALTPNGYLFLGHAETLRGLSQDFHLRHTHGTFYYQRKEDEVSLTTPNDWPNAIQQASDRIHRLTQPSLAAPTQQRSRAGSPDAVQLQFVLELLERERFSEALDLLGRLPAETEQNADVLLLRAALLTHSGQLGAAERACDQLLERDDLNAGAHYLLALCCESAGDRDAAVDHDRTAVYLDPGFAMARLHLGLMARRMGDLPVARHELGQALLLLKREDTSRLLLFGGGFGREALIALCRAELLAAGEQR